MAGVERFDRLLDDAIGALPEALRSYLDDVELAVAEVPVVRDGDAAVSLSDLRRLHPGRARRRGSSARARLTLYRRPLEARATSRDDLVDLVQLVVVQELADHFGIDDDRLDELGFG